MTPNLPDLRIQIDKLDKELLALLNQRAHVAEQVGEVKKREGTPFFRPDRVAAVIAKIQQANTGPLKNEHVAAIWNEIMSACLALESPVRVAYLGPAGTFSEQAALNFFGASIEHVSCNSIDEVFRATAGGSANYGVVPVENSTEGVISRSLDLFLTSPLHIMAKPVCWSVTTCCACPTPLTVLKWFTPIRKHWPSAKVG
jgi:chorismate mutase/prephenate dehydratase